MVCENRNRSALLRELLSNISLFVGQLYAGKSLALRARDLLCFTTDLQTVIYYSTIHAIELMCFLIKIFFGKYKAGWLIRRPGLCL